jgi:hypothetical protein
MNPQEFLSRRAWLWHAGGGLGSLALASLASVGQESPLRFGGLPSLPHFAPKAKRVICLFMSGGFSQLESFDCKPELQKREHQPVPDAIFKKRAPVGMSRLQSAFPLQPSAFPFQQHGQSGAWVSDRFPHLARQVDRICFLKGMVSDAVNHDPAIIFMNSGSQLPGRPVMGSWLSYGLGSENESLPAFVVMVTQKPVDQPLSSRLWDCAFLPSQHQGTPFRASREAVLFLRNPKGLPDSLQRRSLDALTTLQNEESNLRGDPAILARLAQHEMAFRMQSAVPEVTDLSSEKPETLARYGPDAARPGSFAANCILARRLSEKGVRFVQLYHPGWDQHGDLEKGFSASAAEVDQPIAALLDDLHDRGLLSDTLVVFLTEFGRTPYSQGGIKALTRFGREHHRDAFTCWLAGAGVKPGMSFGKTDELGFEPADGRVTVNDLHATLLHLTGIDHLRFTFPFQGRDFRLTDVAGSIIKPILS